MAAPRTNAFGSGEAKGPFTDASDKGLRQKWDAFAPFGDGTFEFDPGV